MLDYITLIITLLQGSLSIFWKTVDVYLLLTLLIIIFATPPLLLIKIFKESISIYFFPIIGFLNLMFCLAFVYLFQLFATNWPYYQLLFIVLLPFIIQLLIFTLLMKRVFKTWNTVFSLPVIKTKEWLFFFMLCILHLLLFSLFTLNSYDPVIQKFFVPGYQINHDSMVVLRYADIIDYAHESKESSKPDNGTRSHYFTNYGAGGPMLTLLVAKLIQQDPYIVFTRTINFIYALGVFTIFGFIELVVKRKSILTYAMAVLVTFLSVFSYLPISIINTSVSASVISGTILLFTVLLIILWNLQRIPAQTFKVLLFLSIFSTVFIYSFYQLFYVPIVILILPILGFNLKKYFNVMAITAIIMVGSLLLPPNYSLIRDSFSIGFSSTAPENNLMTPIMGNTIGFLSPLMGQSLWYFNPDYRFNIGTSENYWIYFFLILVIIAVAIYPTSDEHKYLEHKKIAIILLLVASSLVIFTYFITASPYQNAKALFNFALFWPLILFFVFSPKLISNDATARVIATSALLLISSFMIKSSFVTFRYVGIPFVESNYELMRNATEICGTDKSIGYIGRDEWSKYFLRDCPNISFFYDRDEGMVRPSKLWELNDITSLYVACNNPLQMTDDFQSQFERVLVDKCFVFNYPNYRSVKDYSFHTLYERIE